MSHIGTKFILAEKFTFDPLSNTLIDKEDSEEIIRLGSNESRILWLLAQRPNEVISRNEICMTLFGESKVLKSMIPA